MSRNFKNKAAAAALAGALAVAALTNAVNTAQAVQVPGVNFQILVLDDQSAMVGALIDRMQKEGVPHRVVNLNATRTPITNDYLAPAVNSQRHPQFSGIILPSDSPTQLSAAERQALADYETNYRVREFSAYSWPGAAATGSNNIAGGVIDGQTASVTPSAKTDGFGYLTGSFKMDDIDPNVGESYAYVTSPAPAPGTVFTPMVTTNVPGTTTVGTIIGVHTQGTRERMISTVAMNGYQSHFRVMSHGILSWLTKGVSLGWYRNYLSVHIDDVGLPDGRWNKEANCTMDGECPITAVIPPEGETSRMNASDVTFLRDWQNRTGVKMDLVYNAGGFDQYKQANGGRDPLEEALRANKSRFRWINHTYEHPYMGCIQTANFGAWSCVKDAAGNVQYYSRTDIYNQINQNITWAGLAGVTIDRSELVTGEHSGLRSLPQMPVDNPNLALALNSTGVKWIASDASREFHPRKIGNATTVPRYPMNIYYNTSRKDEAVDEYNYIYNSRGNGGSGICDDNPATTTCIAALDPASGFDSYIRPLEARIAYSHVLDNSARPHYAHQSNLTEDRILYPVIDDVLALYKATFATNTPIKNPSMAAAGNLMVGMQKWNTYAPGKIQATIVGDKLVVKNVSGASASVPVTAPATAFTQKTDWLGFVTKTPWGEAYAGKKSQWVTLANGGSTTIHLGKTPYVVGEIPNNPVTQIAAAGIGPALAVNQEIG